MQATPEALLKAIAPYRGQIVRAAECMFPWSGLADLWAAPEIPFGLGHALSRQAIHGGKAKNDTIDAQKIAVRLRGGMLPQASGSPAERRATRDLRRRRLPLTRTRAALLAPVHNTNRQYPLPAIGKKMASTANREGSAERCADPAVPKSIAGDLALIPYDDALWRDVERTIVTTAKHHDAHPLSLLPTVPGLGKLLRLVRRYAIHQIDRFPRGQAGASYGRLGKGAKASAGKRSGPSGPNIGHAPLQWAFSEAAVLCLRDHPAGQPCLTRLEQNQGKGKALTIFAHTWARAISCMFKNKRAFAMATVLHSEGRGVGELAAYRDSPGMPLTRDALSCPHTCVAECR